MGCRSKLALALVLVLGLSSLEACSLCPDSGLLSPTFRQEAALPLARLILHGTIANPRTTTGLAGQTDFHIHTTLRSHPIIKDKSVLVLPRYLPVNDKEKPHYLLFCDVEKDKVDPYRGVRIQGLATIEYVKKALAMNATHARNSLPFFFKYLEDADPEVARDAFFEFAKANDADLAAVAPRLDAARLRAWLFDPKTRPERLNVYALLLGASGKAQDAALLRDLLDSKEERYGNAADGLLAGYITLKPCEGWELAHSLLADGKKPILLRLAAVRTLRYFHGAQPKESRSHIIKAMKTLLMQGELADLAIEDLRRFEIWDLTSDILALYGKKGYDAPLMRRAIIRYALCCKPSGASADFLKSRRAEDAELVKEVEEGLKLEKGA